VYETLFGPSQPPQLLQGEGQGRVSSPVYFAWPSACARAGFSQSRCSALGSGFGVCVYVGMGLDV
jgi:hypothetical protein